MVIGNCVNNYVNIFLDLTLDRTHYAVANRIVSLANSTWKPEPLTSMRIVTKPLALAM